jgi:hemolysin III
VPTDLPAREPVNGRVHLGGAVLAAAGLFVLVGAAAGRGTLRHGVALGAFGLTAVLMFAASALYHLSARSARSSALRRLDHAMIYVFIAGTYTPVCLLALRGTGLGVGLLCGVWAMAVAGVLHKAVWFHAPRGLSTALYIGMGWVGVIAAPTLVRVAPPGLFTWLLVGGLFYTVGAVVYWVRWPRGVPGVFGFHELWHLFVLAGSASHYWAILSYVAPLG